MDATEIRTRREALGLSRHALAAEIGVSDVTLWRWERGLSSPHPLLERALRATLTRLEEEHGTSAPLPIQAATARLVRRGVLAP